MSQEMHETTDYIPPLKVHIVTSDLKEKRPPECRVSHRTIVLTATNPVQMAAGVDPARKEMLVSVMDNAIVLSNSNSQASDPANQIGVIVNPNGRLLPVSSGNEYCVPGGSNEVWFSTGTYPTKVSITIVREI